MVTEQEKRAAKAAYMREYRRKNPKYAEYMRGYLVQYYKDNAEKIKQRARGWTRDNKEQKSTTNKNHYVRNKEYYNKQAKAWYLNNKERHQECAKKWIEKNLERYTLCRRQNLQTRRARIRGNVIGIVNYSAIIARCNNICGICNETIEGAFHFDHVIPLAKGGEHSDENLQMAHPRCNRMKGAKLNFSLAPATLDIGPV